MNPIINNKNTITLVNKPYPKGGKYLITGTKKVDGSWSHQLKDLQTNQHVRYDGEGLEDVVWFEDSKLKTMIKKIDYEKEQL